MNIVAIAAAIMLHLGLLAWATQPQAATALPQQVMRVNFVAPPSSPQEAQTESEVVEKKTIRKKHKDGLHKKKEARRHHKKRAKKNRKAAASRHTSGRTSDHATAQHSAQTEPLFNAEYLNNPAPVYPYNARRAHHNGTD